jgi:hypothetical protein
MLWPVYTILNGDATVAAIVGDKIFEDVADPDTATPYVVWQTIGGGMENYLDERPGIDNARVQVDCYHRTKKAARELALAVRNALELQAHQVGQPRTEYDAALELYRYSMDFSFWVNR